MRALVIDLNNFSRYPTLSVGLLVGVLRSSGVDVEVLSPLARGVQGYPRLTRARPWSLIEGRLRYWSAVSPSKSVRRLRALAACAMHPGTGSDSGTIVAYARELLGRHDRTSYWSRLTRCTRASSPVLAALCPARGMPLVWAGTYFFRPQNPEPWAPDPRG